MILALFDIDGTLLASDGLARQAFGQALIESYGTAGPIEGHDFGGKTDPLIIDELLQAAGWTPDAIAERQGEAIDRYLAHLETALADRSRVTLLPGVRQLLDALSADPEVLLGVLTGNVARGAHLKLEAVGLAGYFRLGAYGSDHASRDELPAIAVARALELYGRTFSGREVVIIGDTPRDIACGRGIRARALAVATGSHPAPALAAHRPDYLFDTLEATHDVLRCLYDFS